MREGQPIPQPSKLRTLIRPAIIRGLTLKERVQTGAHYNPLADGFHQDPTADYTRLRTKDPVHYSELLRGWVISRHEDIDAILRDHKRFSNDNRNASDLQFEGSDAIDQRSMLGLDPPDHTRLRSLVNQAFTPRAIEAWRPRIEETVDELLDAIGDARRFDAIEALAVPLPIVVISDLLGIPREDRARFKAWSDRVARTLEPTITPTELAEAMEARDELRAYLDVIVRERAREPREDLVSVLATAEEAGDRLTQDEVLATLILLLVAGNETTTNLIGNGLYALLGHPEQMRWVREHPERVDVAVEELLRYDSPVQTNARTALADVEIGGKVVRKGQQVILLQGAANHDPAQYAEADRLDLARGDRSHVSFGRGIHHCLGAPLARLEGQLIFPRLLARYPDLHLASGAKPRFRDQVVLRGLRSLEVEV
ncbi:MAG: cytochrome P450 [Dehalococcoidia bacterium]|nr:cytochrome P450 [Dehalococcoidia bacterium]